MFKKFLVAVVLCTAILSMGIIASADNITWQYDDQTNVLTIKGAGEMTNAPWNDEIDVTKVKKIVIENGITSICDNAFCIFTEEEGMLPYENLQKVEIPESVTEIGVRAFSWAEKLTDVKLPAKLKKLGMISFMGTGIKEITIPKTLTKWERTAFANCPDLVNVTIEDGVTKIPDFTFFNTPITQIIVPDSVVCLGEYVFSGCANLEYVDLPRGLVTIGVYAFEDCESLTSIDIPNTVKILNGALDNWYLETVQFGGSKAEWDLIQGNETGNSTTVVTRREALDYKVSGNENETTLSWKDYPGADRYELCILAYNREAETYEKVESYEFNSATSFTMEYNGYEDGLYCAELWVYSTWTEDMDFSDMMWKEVIYFAVGESKGQDTYALTSVETKELSNGKLFVEAEFVERNRRNASDMFVIAVYEDNVMVDMAFVTGNIITGVPFSFGSMVEVSENATLKAFVWDGIEGMKTLSNVVEK